MNGSHDLISGMFIASSTDDLWLLTASHEVYQDCPHDARTMKSVENDWLLV